MQRIFTKKSYGFTLMELLVVIVIIGVLSVVLFRTFGTISEIAFRVEQEKNVTQEIINFSQILQNYADKNQIDYARYQSGELTVLSENYGLTTVLYLSGQDGRVSFYSSGECAQPGEELLSGVLESKCVLCMQKDGQEIKITNPKKTYLSQVVFKIIPFASQEQYLANTGYGALIYALNKPGFWIITQVRNARYSPHTRGNRVQIPVQQFFNLK